MTMKHVGLISLVVLSCVTGALVLGSRCPTTDPTNAMAAFFVFGAHCPTVSEVVPTAASPAEKPTPAAPAISDFRFVDSAGREVAIADLKDKQVIAVVFVGTDRSASKNTRRR